MPKIYIDQVYGVPGVRLFEDISKVKEIEQIEIIPPSTTLVILSKFIGKRLYKVFESISGVFSVFSDYKLYGNSFKLTSQVNSIVCIPAGKLRIVSLNETVSKPVPIYIAYPDGFEFSDLSITAVDPETGLTGIVKFSETENGAYQCPLVLSSLPNVVWVKSYKKAVGSSYNVPITTNVIIYV